jgi:Xaa-Pro aminopeptidase
MRPSASRTFVRRLDHIRGTMHVAGLDAFVVTHLPNLEYLTGFRGTAGLGVISQDHCRLVVDFRYATSAVELLTARGETAITLDVTDKSFDESAQSILRDGDFKRIGIEAASMSVSRFNRLSAGLAASAPTPLVTAGPCPALVPTERVVESARAVKDDEEIAVLREAGARLSRVARTLRSFTQPGRSEQDVSADIEKAMREAGFERPAFPTIVASGPNSALPHARPGSRLLQAGDPVVLDFGGVYDGYCVDLTRTVLLGGQSSEVRRMFGAVAEAQAAAIAAVRPGVLPSAIDAAARDVLERHGLGSAFGHATGHGLGLEVHEEPRIARRASSQPEAPVEAGMVFTIEPGAYVPGLGGIRIEDDVLVVKGGCERLTDVPVEL